jgi:hypothetical protein
MMLLNWRMWAVGLTVTLLAYTHHEAFQFGEDKVRLQWEEAKVADAQAAAEREREWNDQIAKERENAARREAVIRRDAAGARDALVRLYASADEAMRAAAGSHEACIVTAATGVELLKQCSRDYQGLAEAADRHVSDVKTLIGSWPK